MNKKNNNLNVSLVIAIENTLKEGAKDIDDIRERIKQKYDEIYPREVIKQCLEEDVISFQDLVSIEDEDLQLIWKNNVDNAHIVRYTNPSKNRNKS